MVDHLHAVAVKCPVRAIAMVDRSHVEHLASNQRRASGRRWGEKARIAMCTDSMHGAGTCC